MALLFYCLFVFFEESDVRIVAEIYTLFGAPSCLPFLTWSQEGTLAVQCFCLEDLLASFF